MKLTNEQKIGLSMAVFLATDDYDYDPRPTSISATGLLRSVRQAVLSKRAESTIEEIDISTKVASRFGSAVHDAVEKSWMNGRYKPALKKLGYSDSVIERVIVNPGYKTDEFGRMIKDPDAPPLAKDAIPVYMEIRSEREVDGWIVTGKFDFIGDGELEDHKTTGTYSYQKDPKPDKFRKQGSIYRWLNPDLITSDRLLINYTFTDFSALRATIEKAKGYPPHRMMTVPMTMLTLEDTEKFIKDKLSAISAAMNLPEPNLPPCTKEELWQEETVYKYYKDPNKKARSTKNFDNFAAAQHRLNKDGGVGTIDIVKGEVKFCKYCPANQICSQAKQLVHDGLLTLEV